MILIFVGAHLLKNGVIQNLLIFLTTPDRSGCTSNIVQGPSRAEKMRVIQEKIISSEWIDKKVKKNVKQSGLDIAMILVIIPNILKIVIGTDLHNGISWLKNMTVCCVGQTVIFPPFGIV